MKRLFIPFLFIVIASVGMFFLRPRDISVNYGAQPYIEDEVSGEQYTGRFGDLSNWVRPAGPLRVGLQAGHWENKELPDELHKLRDSSGGTSSGSVTEWEVNLKIAEETKKILEREGVVVDILPATIPPAYYADVVVSIHADGSTNPSTSGFKVAASRRNISGKANKLVKIMEDVYQKHTRLEIDPNISRNMTGYYAFNWRRYEHSIHPMAPAVILETGFLTNPSEARMLINNPELPARAIAEALIKFLGEEM
jgi:hypothetical protein